jgi:hypothetical protein
MALKRLLCRNYSHTGTGGMIHGLEIDVNNQTFKKINNQVLA